VTDFSESLRDRAIALAKERCHPEVSGDHVIGALLATPSVIVVLNVDPAAVPDVIGPHGDAIDPPSVSGDAERVIAECPDAAAAARVLVRELAQRGVRAGVHTSRVPGGVAPSPSGDEPTLEDALAELDALVGLDAVKHEIRALTALHGLNGERASRGMSTVPVGLHLVFTGNPGTGKTTVARLVASIYRGLGILPKGHLVEVQRADLIAGFVGQTALKVAAVADSAMGGVLFIDEAYALASGSDQDYGQEAIATLVKIMEDRRDQLAVIAAGYSTEMERFVRSNSGLRSRFQRFIDFADYSDSDLVEIFVKLAGSHGIGVPPEVRERLEDHFAGAPPEIRVGNGRFARNTFEGMYARMALRASSDDIITDAEIRDFVVADVPSPSSAHGETSMPGYL